MILRPYKPCDAVKIVSWCRDEDTFLRWGGAHIGDYPLTADVLDEKYQRDNGGCVEADNFYPFTAAEDGKPVGSFILRYLHGDPKVLRIGWVIVDETLRGRGYGKSMLSLALRLGFEIMDARVVTIGVYEENIPARRCYEAAGFRAAAGGDSFDEAGGVRRRVIEMEITREEYKKMQSP